MSTFPGKLSEISGISIDRFDETNLNSVAYFLSHCHTDHMAGLRDKCFIRRLAENREINLYCSPITRLILQFSGLSSVAHKIISLPIGPENLLTIPDGKDNRVLTVTLIPAGHCPGSVMFLFEGDYGKIVYTGDFRISAQDVKNLKPFYDISGQIKPITKVYLDTTFIRLHGTSREIFPSRKESAEEVVKLISKWLSQGTDHFVNIRTSAKYGSEYLLMDIASKLRTHIRVSDANYKVYGAIPEISWAVTNSESAQIYAGINYISKTDLKTITIRPSALWWCNLHDQKLAVPSMRRNLTTSNHRYYQVMYACHASPEEIKALLRFLQPKKIEPCVIPDGLTYGEIVSICYTMLNEVMPVPPSLSETADHPTLTTKVCSNTVKKAVVIELDSDSEEESLIPSPTYKMCSLRGIKRKRE